MSGKGDRPRPVNREKWEEGWACYEAARRAAGKLIRSLDHAKLRGSVGNVMDKRDDLARAIKPLKEKPTAGEGGER